MILRTAYVDAAIDRLEDSRLLVEASAYAGAIYYSGLAAESMLKGFIDAKSEEKRME
jgi:HEPN domain-containing protein